MASGMSVGMPDREWLDEYSKDSKVQPAFKIPKSKKKDEEEEQPSKFYQQRRMEDSGAYPRPRIKGY